MTRAISEYKISGVQTTLEFCSWAINHEAFKSGNFDTHFVKDYFTPEILKQELTSEETEVAAIAAEILFHQNNASAFPNGSTEQKTSAWKLRARD
jgi:propionyl-CoA carboxylase alpha chain